MAHWKFDERVGAFRWFPDMLVCGSANGWFRECPLLSCFIPTHPSLHARFSHVFSSFPCLPLNESCGSLLVCTSLGYSRYTLSFVEHRRDTRRVPKGGSLITGSLSPAPADTSGSPPTHRSRLAVTRAHGVSRSEALVWDGCVDERHITPATHIRA